MLNVFAAVRNAVSPLLSSRRRRRGGLSDSGGRVAALESRRLLTAGTQPDFFDVDPYTGNLGSVSANDTDMTNYQLVSQGQYCSMSVDSDGNVIISGDIPEGFVDHLTYKAEWMEYTGDMYDGTYTEVVHVEFEDVAAVRKEPMDGWSLENLDTIQSGTNFTVHGTGVPGATATLILQLQNVNNQWPEVGRITIGVDADGKWEYSGTAPSVNATRTYKYVLEYTFEGEARQRADTFKVAP